MIRQNFISIIIICLFLISCSSENRQTFYLNEFHPEDVALLDGPFRQARDLNIKVLLEYDVDRLFATFRKEAGLPEKAELFPNWKGLDGHVAGHYLSAMAMNYTAVKNEECRKRMEYIISELRECQEANGERYPDWGKGYVGGVPNSDTIWSTLKKGDFKAYRSAWVPWYNVHKIFAGLRDAWFYTGNNDAKDIFLKFCDWGIDITSMLSDEQMQSMLDTEHGGMNEIFADAYQMTGDSKYLEAAKRFSHRVLLDSMADGIDNLDNKHANTQVPKAIGFQRIAELTNEKQFIDAGSFFWETVTKNRTLAFGGNSRREHFPDENGYKDFVNEVQGPESCNSYNMLRLTKGLFRIKQSAQYVDYYERTLFNHILSTQHPEHGGFVYFTPARPRHYRVYSAPNEAMWCCVGSGMENHGKYNQFIYTHSKDSLYLNLFIASELNWKEKGIKIKQETAFPFEEQTKLTFAGKSAKFTLLVRYPSWVKDGALKVTVNGNSIDYNTHPSSYLAIDRTWMDGDVVQIMLPMHNSIEQLPNVPEYVAFLHGPILLAAETGKEDLKGLIADDSRWGHIASGERLPVDEAPVIINTSADKIPELLIPVENNPLVFKLAASSLKPHEEMILEPFFMIHDARYMMYWKIAKPE